MRKRKIRRKTHLCPNCETVLERDENYCHVCGQENHNLNVPMKDLIMEFIGSITFFETKFIDTASVIFTHPGKLTLDFNSGKRVKYMHPVRMYFWVSAIFFFAMSSEVLKPNYAKQLSSKAQVDSTRKEKIKHYNQGREFARMLKRDINNTLTIEPDRVQPKTNSDLVQGIKDAKKEYYAPKDSTMLYLGIFQKLIIPKDSISYFYQLNDENLDSVLKARNISTFFPVRKTIRNSLIKEYHRYLEEKYGIASEINGRTILFDSYLPTIMFIILPFAAFILWFFERHTKWRFYFQHLVFTLNTHSAIFLFWAICDIIGDFYKYFFSIDTNNNLSGYVVLFVLILSMIYFIISLKTVYQQSWWKTFAKFLLLTTTYSLLFLLIVIIGIASGLMTV